MRSNDPGVSDDDCAGPRLGVAELATYLLAFLLGVGALHAIGDRADQQTVLVLHILIPLLSASAGIAAMRLRRRGSRTQANQEDVSHQSRPT